MIRKYLLYAFAFTSLIFTSCMDSFLDRNPYGAIDETTFYTEAEHTMLVDLGRNDVGKVSKFGTVEVKNFMTVEKYSKVTHLVSDVQGELRDDENPINALMSVLPAGTLSGAPKVRAMEIIDELENKKRGVYGGTVGYLGFDGNIDTCIAIRTVVFKDGKGYVQAGAGIVNDSVPEKEFMETKNKALAVVNAVKEAARL